MDTFQMNPKEINTDLAFHNPHDMEAFYRLHNVKRIPTRPHTLWPNRAEKGVRLSKKFLLALVDTASNNLDQTTLTQITPALVDSQGGDSEKYSKHLKWQDAHGVGRGDGDQEISWTQLP